MLVKQKKNLETTKKKIEDRYRWKIDFFQL